MLNKDEHFEPLGNGVEVIVSAEHHFFTDTILLAHFANPKKSEKAVDLGSGCGTIPLLWSRKNTPQHTYAVEIQANGADMINRSVIHNNLQEKITVLNEDMRKLKGKLPFGTFDLVVCNPPYKPVGTGFVNKNTVHTVIRHEFECTVADAVKAAADLLRFGGRFCLCLRPERLTDVITAFRNNNVEPKKLRFVQQRTNKEPKLFLIEGKYGGKKGGLTVLPNLMIENEAGEFSEEMLSVYGDYRGQCED
ncbi:SAM-dependent methyltransferase [Clostridia bacterium]|nr:SAM-dependent methyltransferase [Clostridia bacterium]